MVNFAHTFGILSFSFILVFTFYLFVMTFREYFALKSLTTEEFAESLCLLIDKNLIHEDKDSFLQEILGDKYEEYLSLLD